MRRSRSRLSWSRLAVATAPPRDARTGVPSRPRALAVTLVVLLVAWSGCLGGESDEVTPPYGVVVKDPPPTPVSSPTATPGSSAPPPANGTPSPSPTPDPSPPRTDRPPEASLDADRTYGTGPLTVRFRLDGSDPEGRPLTWTFDADGDGKREAHGSSLPATVTHTFPLGTWEAVFKVTDGNDTTIVRRTIEAVSPAPTGPPEPVRLRGTITGVWVQGIGFVPETNNHTFLLPRSVERITAAFTSGLAAVDLDYELYAPDGRRVGRQAHFNEPTGELPPPFIGREEPAIVVEGADAARTGSWTLRVMPALAVEGEYVIDVTFA